MEATRSPYREVHHAAPEPGGYEFINPGGWRTSALMRIPDSRRILREVRKGQQETLLLLLSARKQAMKIPVILLLANASLSESIQDVIVLATKLRIARTCIAHLTGPLDREVRPDCIQFG